MSLRSKIIQQNLNFSLVPKVFRHQRQLFATSLWLLHKLKVYKNTSLSFSVGSYKDLETFVFIPIDQSVGMEHDQLSTSQQLSS